MSGKKYKIYQNGQFLGHWCAPEDYKAIRKMLNSSYAKVYNVSPDDYFDIYKGSEYFHVHISKNLLTAAQ